MAKGGELQFVLDNYAARRTPAIKDRLLKPASTCPRTDRLQLARPRRAGTPKAAAAVSENSRQGSSLGGDLMKQARHAAVVLPICRGRAGRLQYKVHGRFSVTCRQVTGRDVASPGADENQPSPTQTTLADLNPSPNPSAGSQFAQMVGEDPMLRAGTRSIERSICRLDGWQR